MTIAYSLLDEPLIRTRLIPDGEPVSFTLPGLFVAMAEDRIRDFPALRPHQRHPWHAFLVQVAALALHRTGISEPFADSDAWKSALLTLTPDDADGAAWCLLAPHDRPAFMQPPVPGENPDAWKNRLDAPDQLDMLVTSKNHDVKAARMLSSTPDDWLMALVSLQTQEGVLGAGKYGISRMNGGFASRPALGVVPAGQWGRRWRRDLEALLESRTEIIQQNGLDEEGIGLIWPIPWDGNKSLSFNALDPFYIEICRRVRLVRNETRIIALDTGSKVARIAAKELKGQTGDPWTPIDVGEAKALTITARGFDYRLATELLYGTGKYRHPLAQGLRANDGDKGIVILAQGISRGQGKTEGYHERRIPISPKVRRLLLERKTDQVAAVAEKRVQAIAQMRKVLWSALATLFDNGAPKDKFSDGASDKANTFTQPFERKEDSRFFHDLNAEMEADAPQEVFLHWLASLAERAETTLLDTFTAGPRSGEQRYRARAKALSRFHGTLRGEKSPLPMLADHYRKLRLQKEPDHVDP